MSFPFEDSSVTPSNPGGPFQPLDADLTAIAALAGTGYLARIAADTWALRTFQEGANIDLVNADGVAGNTTIAVSPQGSGSGLDADLLDGLDSTAFQPIDADLTALAALATTGYAVRTGAGTWTTRTFTSSTGIGLTNADGVAGATDIAPANDLAAVEALATTGIAVRTALETWATRTLQQPAAGITITNPAGIAGDPTFALANDLAALEALAGGGFAVRTAADTWAQRILVAPAAGITITNATGVAGNPTFALANDLAALEAMAGTGLVARTASETYAQRTITGPAAGITVSNGDGVAGNPTLALANDLAALEAMASTGIVVRTASETYAQRTLQAPAAGLTITNPAGIAGDPTFALANDLSALEALGGTGIASRTGTDTWVVTSGTAGRVMFWGTSIPDDDGVFVFDDTDKLVGIGTGAPTGKLHLAGLTDPAGGTIRPALLYNQTLTVTGASNVLDLLDVSPVFTTTNAVPSIGTGYFRAGGTWTQTTTNPLLYTASALLADMTFTSATNGVAPVFPDLIFSQYTVSQTAGTATATNLSPISFLAGPTLLASGTASLTIAGTVGTGALPAGLYAFFAGVNLTEGASATLVTPTVCALGIDAPTVSGAPAITELVGIDIASLTAGTTNLSLRSRGTGVEMRHAGPSIVGINAGLVATERLRVHQATIGNDVARFESAATNDDPNLIIRQGRVTTTNATVTTLMTYTLTAANAYLIEARVVAHRTGGAAGAADDSAAYVVYAGAKHTGGVAALITAVGADYTDEDQAGWNATMDVNGNDVRVRVTGAADNNITWHCTLLVQNVSS